MCLRVAEPEAHSRSVEDRGECTQELARVEPLAPECGIVREAEPDCVDGQAGSELCEEALLALSVYALLILRARLRELRIVEPVDDERLGDDVRVPAGEEQPAPKILVFGRTGR